MSQRYWQEEGPSPDQAGTGTAGRTVRKRLHRSFADAELTEYGIENFLGSDCAGDLGDVIQSVLDIDRHQIRRTLLFKRLARQLQADEGLPKGIHMPAEPGPLPRNSSRAGLSPGSLAGCGGS